MLGFASVTVPAKARLLLHVLTLKVCAAANVGLWGYAAKPGTALSTPATISRRLNERTSQDSDLDGFNFTLHIHVSGTGGTALCQLSRKVLRHVPGYNCELPFKKHGDWNYMLPSNYDSTHPWQISSCAGLRNVVRTRNYLMGMAESPAPYWLDCPGVQYTYFMVNPVHRVMRWAYEYCVEAVKNKTHEGEKWAIPPTCDPMTWLRQWYNTTAGWQVQYPGWHGHMCFYGTPAVSEYNLRFLLPTVEAFQAPLGTLGHSHLEQAKKRLLGFKLAIAIDDSNPKISLQQALDDAFGWPRHIQHVGSGATFDAAKRAIKVAPPENAELVSSHNRLDLKLYAWLKNGPIINGVRHTKQADTIDLSIGGSRRLRRLRRRR